LVVTLNNLYTYDNNCYHVSIPQSGFLVVTPTMGYPILAMHFCFNPSVGILGGHTGRM